MTVSIVVTEANFPLVFDAFLAIECDSGSHLIGTVYPGKKTDLTSFEVPDEFTSFLVDAERSLERLSTDDFEAFVIGDMSTMTEIAERQGDLGPAKRLLDAFFNEWGDTFDEDAYDESSHVEHLSRADIVTIMVACGTLVVSLAVTLLFFGMEGFAR